MLPDFLFQRLLPNELKKISNYDSDYVMKRVNYYNKLGGVKIIVDNVISLKDFRLIKRIKPTTHFLDTYQFTRYFPRDKHIAILFGDVTHIPPYPTIVKSRPIENDNENSVILKLNKLRHYVFVNDKVDYKNKKDMLVGRCAIYQQNRINFFMMYYGHPMCNLGHVGKKRLYSEKWIAPYMQIEEQLKYKFILSLEGNDVASNLKWIMSSNSIAVMPKPTFETWFMEGTLIPDYHYVMIKDDFSDLQERLEYYIKNIDAAQKIIKNANQYVKQFQNRKQEKLISLLVLKKYFEHTRTLDNEQ